MAAGTRTADVVVVGGGAAGVAAAVVAARLGARTLLLERSGRLGGTHRDGLHPFLCGLYRHAPDAPFDPLQPGLAMEVANGVDRWTRQDGRRRLGRVEVHAAPAALYAHVLTALAKAEPRLTVALRTRLVAATVQDDAVARMSVAGQEAGVVSGGVVIDCSGRADLIELCGAGREPEPGQRSSTGFCMHLSRLDDPEGLAPVLVPYHVRKAIERGELPAVLRYTVFSREAGGTGGVCKLSLWATPPPRAHAQARALSRSVHRVLRTRTREFRRSVVDERSPRLLERVGSALAGKHQLTEEEVLQGRAFADGCVRAAWPIEFWDPVAGPALNYLRPGACYEVPARCLQSAKLRNLLAAGRCISATAHALSSLRVTGVCLALGEAAARLAAQGHEPVPKPCQAAGSETEERNAP